MKRLLGLLLVVGLLVIGCEDPPPPVPYCEQNNIGTVTVKNETGYTIYTDVTWGSYDTNYEKMLYDNGSYKYTKVPAGSIEIWITFDGDDWSWNRENVSACEDMTYRWYIATKKATNGCPFIIDIGNGELVVPTKRQS